MNIRSLRIRCDRLPSEEAVFNQIDTSDENKYRRKQDIYRGRVFPSMAIFLSYYFLIWFWLQIILFRRNLLLIEKLIISEIRRIWIRDMSLKIKPQRVQKSILNIEIVD
jgi:hypothetical protein